MKYKEHRICLISQLGKRSGTLCLLETDEGVNGWLDVMNHRNPLSGHLSGDGHITLSGSLRTLVSTMRYTAEGTLRERSIHLHLKTESGMYYPVSGEELTPDDKTL